MSAATLLPPSSVAPAPAANASGAKTNPYSDLSSSDFMKIMLSELSNQDPFKPNDSAALLEQMSSLRNIESSLSLQESLKSLVLQNSIGQAGALIGKTIQGLDGDGRTISGTVASVRINNGKAVLELDSGVTLGMDRVTSVTNAPAAPVTPAPGTAAPAPASVGIPTGADAAASALTDVKPAA